MLRSSMPKVRNASARDSELSILDSVYLIVTCLWPLAAAGGGEGGREAGVTGVLLVGNDARAVAARQGGALPQNRIPIGPFTMLAPVCRWTPKELLVPRQRRIKVEVGHDREPLSLKGGRKGRERLGLDQGRGGGAADGGQGGGKKDAGGLRCWCLGLESSLGLTI
jgi:hypothetical protein